MKACYLCDEPFTEENMSKEHILLNAIGGHLKPKDLLCKPCNSKLGETADAELAKQLSFLSSFLQIKRDNGENQTIKGGQTKDGTKYNLIEGSKPIPANPIYERTEVDGNVNISVTARSEAEMLNMLKGLKKEFPQLDMENIKKHFQYKEEYLEEPLSFRTTIGGELAFRSLVKTAVNFYVYTIREKEAVKHLFNYLKGLEKLKICKHHHSKKAVYKKEAGEVVHLLHLMGIKRERTLFCYIELFSTYSFIVLLSDNYDGKNIEESYCYNVLTAKEVKKSVKIKYSKAEFDSLTGFNNAEFKAVREKLGRVMDIGNKIHTQNEISRISSKAVDSVFNRHKGEPVFTPKMAEELSKEVAEAYVKFAHRKRK